MSNQSTPEVTRALKPCPFCGSAAEITLDRGRGAVGVSCTKCTANQPPSWDIASESWARDAWNTRTPARGGDELREALEGLRERCAQMVCQWYDGEPEVAEELRQIVRTVPLPMRTLSSTDMARCGEKVEPWSNDPHGLASELRRVANGWAEGFRLPQLLRDAADQIDTTAPQPLEGLTSGDGWQLVPVEPTEAMLHASIDCPYDGPEDHWAAMLAASPKATATASVREKAHWATPLGGLQEAQGVARMAYKDVERAKSINGHVPGNPYDVAMSALNFTLAALDTALTGSGTAATIGGERA